MLCIRAVVNNYSNSVINQAWGYCEVQQQLFIANWIVS